MRAALHGPRRARSCSRRARSPSRRASAGAGYTRRGSGAWPRCSRAGRRAHVHDVLEQSRPDALVGRCQAHVRPSPCRRRGCILSRLWHIRAMTVGRRRAVLLAAALCSAGVVVVLLTSDREDADPRVGGPRAHRGLELRRTGLYATHRRPASRVGLLMVALGFAWCVAAISLANSALAFSVGLVMGGLWGGVFLHLLVSFPTGRLPPGTDRKIVLAGYGLFTLGASRVVLLGAGGARRATTAPRTSGWSSQRGSGQCARR